MAPFYPYWLSAQRWLHSQDKQVLSENISIPSTTARVAACRETSVTNEREIYLVKNNTCPPGKDRPSNLGKCCFLLVINLLKSKYPNVCSES